MNFHQLEYLIAVSKLQHFGKAAEYCHVTQATLSAMIKKFEEETHVVVFDRGRQPIKITEQGQEVLALAQSILDKRRAIMDLSEDNESMLQGTLKLGIIPTVGNSLLPLLLPVLLEKYPDLQLNITEITTDEIIEGLKKDEIDLGILATPLNEPDIEENILYYEAMMIYGVRDNDIKYITSRDIQDQKIWLLEEGNCFREQSITICDIREKSLKPEKLIFEGSSFDTLLNLTDQFGGYTLVPELYYNLMSGIKKKKTRHFEKPVPVREISLVYSRPYAKKKSIEVLSELIKKLVKGKLSSENFRPSELSIIGIG